MRTTFSHRTLKIAKSSLWAFATIILMVLVYTGERSGMWFKASILEAPQPFSGTVMPVGKVPDWTHWMNGKADMTVHYDQIPPNMLIDLPPYDLTKMQFPDDKLVWGDESQTLIRNTKITYPVVYMGNYKYDHLENEGSHLGVDIKMPIGTPVHAIANGKVVTVSMISSGFGHHIVIEHQGVPDPNNPGQRTTLYSCYDHLSDVNVVEGQNVIKGELIALSGETGTATTPHLHFQIDRDSAPWHPYWPFTSQEATNAGLSFFSAVDAGLGASIARADTVNPMRFTTDNMGAYSVASAVDTSVPTTGSNASNASATSTPTPAPVVVADSNPAPTATTTPDPVVTPTPTTDTQTQTVAPTETDPTSPPSNDASALFQYDISGDGVSLLGNAVPLVVTDSKDQLSKLSDTDTIRASIDGVGTLLKKQFTKSDFVNNTLKLYVRSDVVGTANVMIGKSAFQVSFVDSVKPVSSFKIEADGTFQDSIVETVKVIALDETGSLAAAVNFSGFVEIKTTQGTADITPNYIRKEDFRGGTATIKVVGHGTDPIILRAQNGALIGVSEKILPENNMVFTDVKPDNPNYAAIKYLKDNGISSGYKDGTFKPSQTVNRAEALKMLMLAFSEGASSSGSSTNFKDVNSSAWYAKTIAVAVDKGIAAGYKDGTFKPDQTVNRAEYLKLLLKSASIEPSTTISKPYNDVALTDWFAPYAFLANKMNLLQSSTTFRPADGMTRAGVAETIYRMKMIEAHNWVTYSK
jgi:hypothetical protein